MVGKQWPIIHDARLTSPRIDAAEVDVLSDGQRTVMEKQRFRHGQPAYLIQDLFQALRVAMEARNTKRMNVILAAALDLSSGSYRDFAVNAGNADSFVLPSAATLSRSKYRLDLFLMHSRVEDRRCQREKHEASKAAADTAPLASEHEWIALCSLVASAS